MRILDETKGTGAVTRVLIDASDGHDVWGSIGVSENVIARLLGRARGLARVRHAARQGGSPAGRPATGARARRSAGADPADAQRVSEAIPLARPVLGEAGGAGGGRGAALGPAVARARVWASSSAPSRASSGRRCASAVSSGTAGLHLALRAVGVGEGDEVITSPFSFVASANAALYERARPVFADIDPVTLNLDPQAAAAALSERTRALLPVHIFGYPADMPAFERLAAAHGLAIVEDACEALGARPRRRHAGRRARAPGGVRLLRQQAAHDGRGRDGHARATQR